MQRTGLSCCLATILLICAVGLAEAQVYKQHDIVVVIANAQLKVNGNQVVGNVSPGLVTQVRGVNGGWLWIDEGKPGWLPASCVIPVDRKAIDRLNEMIKANPRDARLYSGRAKAWWNLQDGDKAIADFTDAIRIDPTIDSFYIERATLVLFEGGDGDLADLAIGDCTELIRRHPKNSGYYFDRAVLRSRRKEYAKAIADYDELLRLDPNNANAISNRGGEWLELNDYDRAIADFNEAMRLKPEQAHMYQFNRARARFKQGNYEKAIEDYGSRQLLHPLDFGARAEVWLAMHEYAKAIADCDQAIKQEQYYANHEDYRFIRAVALVVQRQAQSVDGFQQVIDLPNFRGERWKGPLAADSVILGCLAARLNRDQQRADRFLKEAEGKLGETWETNFIQYLRGECDESVVLESALKRDRMLQAHCYLGLDALSKAETQKAKTEFDWVKKNGTKGTPQFVIAEAELKRIAATTEALPE